MMTHIELHAGEKYDVSTISLLGWTSGDSSSSDGYNVLDYFGPDGTYKGPDQHDIEPIVEAK